MMPADGMRLLSRSLWADRASSHGIVVASATASLEQAGPVCAYQESDFTVALPQENGTSLCG